MFVHAFMFRWLKASTPDDEARAAREILAFVGVIDGLVSLTYGENCASNAGGFSSGGVMVFEDAAAYETYCRHPAHLALLSWLSSLIEAVELDLIS